MGPNFARDTIVFIAGLFAVGVIWFTFITGAFHILFNNIYAATPAIGHLYLTQVETIVDLSPFIWIPILIVWYVIRTQQREYQEYST